jgi:hypothetical protein
MHKATRTVMDAWSRQRRHYEGRFANTDSKSVFYDGTCVLTFDHEHELVVNLTKYARDRGMTAFQQGVVEYLQEKERQFVEVRGLEMGATPDSLRLGVRYFGYPVNTELVSPGCADDPERVQGGLGYRERMRKKFPAKEKAPADVVPKGLMTGRVPGWAREVRFRDLAEEAARIQERIAEQGRRDAALPVEPRPDRADLPWMMIEPPEIPQFLRERQVVVRGPDQYAAVDPPADGLAPRMRIHDEIVLDAGAIWGDRVEDAIAQDAIAQLAQGIDMAARPRRGPVLQNLLYVPQPADMIELEAEGDAAEARLAEQRIVEGRPLLNEGPPWVRPF